MRLKTLSPLRIPAVALALASVVAASLALRLYDLNWDRGHSLHPDETFITQVLVERIHLSWPISVHQLFDPASSGLNPRSADPITGQMRHGYAYGSLPLFLTDGIAKLLALATGVDWQAAGRVRLVGRAISGLLDTLTVLTTFFIGRSVFNKRVGLYGATFVAMAPLSIQLAHFYTTDSWLTFLISLSLFFCVRMVQDGRLRWFVATGIAFGLAMATKSSALPFAGLLVISTGVHGWHRGQCEGRWYSGVIAMIAHGGVLCGSAVGAFGLFEPYAVLDPSTYFAALQEQADIQRGIFDVPYTRVYIGTIPVIYHWEQLIKWGLGPVSGVLTLIGLGNLGYRFLRSPRTDHAILLGWFLGYGFAIILLETKFLRYLAPLVPVLAVSAGLAFDLMVSALQMRAGRLIAALGGALLLIGAALSTVAFMSLYAHEHTRLEASRWIYANVPPGSAITAEYWDDALPVDFGPGLSFSDRQYQRVTMDLYFDRPPAEEVTYIYDALAEADYIVLSSNRVSSSIPRSPWRYPVQIRYYELLKEGRLGFSLAKEFTRVPQIGPFRFSDANADEALINYDHPQVLIFKKDTPIDRSTFDQLMTPSMALSWSPFRHPPSQIASPRPTA